MGRMETDEKKEEGRGRDLWPGYSWLLMDRR